MEHLFEIRISKPIIKTDSDYVRTYFYSVLTNRGSLRLLVKKLVPSHSDSWLKAKFTSTLEDKSESFEIRISKPAVIRSADYC